MDNNSNNNLGMDLGSMDIISIGTTKPNNIIKIKAIIGVAANNTLRLLPTKPTEMGMGQCEEEA